MRARGPGKMNPHSRMHEDWSDIFAEAPWEDDAFSPAAVAAAQSADFVAYDQFSCKLVRKGVGAIRDIQVNPFAEPIERVSVPHRLACPFPGAYEAQVQRHGDHARMHCAFCDQVVVEKFACVVNFRQRAKMRMCYTCYHCFFIWDGRPVGYCTKHHCLEDVRAWTAYGACPGARGGAELSQRCVYSTRATPKHDGRRARAGEPRAARTETAADACQE